MFKISRSFEDIRGFAHQKFSAYKVRAYYAQQVQTEVMILKYLHSYMDIFTKKPKEYNIYT